MATQPRAERYVDQYSIWGQLGDEPQHLIPVDEFNAAKANWAQQSGQGGAGTTAVQAGAVGGGGAVGNVASGGVGAGGIGAGQSANQLGFAASVADPWAAQRGQYQTQLNNLMQGGVSAVANDPSVMARQQAGEQALSRSMASQGYLGSGNILSEIQKQGQNIASQEYQNQFSRLATLAGVNAGSPQTAGNILAQIPGQQLAEQQTGFNQNVASQMLPYQLAQAQQGIASGGIEAQLNQQALSDMQLAARQKQGSLLQQLSQPVQIQTGSTNTGWGGAIRPEYGYADPTQTTVGTLSNGMSITDYLNQRKSYLGLI